MTQEQYEELYNWVYEEIHHNRDVYSRSKIIEMIIDKTEKLVNKTNDIHDVMCSVKVSDLKSLGYEEEYYEHFECPKCKSSIEMANYCSNCGIKIVD